ncbi:MAG: type II toxin-antitoxin system VapC family toxin [Candidatus Brockarchaeota archaeon]|nr:type II toxin-antitoxin system VapC family toxin [Candidatus Brockarchaeota archaeon]
MKAIVDASSLLTMIKNIEGEALLSRLNGLATLDMAFYEIGNALWKQVSIRGVASREELKRVVLAVGKVFLMNSFIKIGWRDLDYSAVFDLAVGNGITFYDASYLMASIVFKKPLVTEDEKLKRVAAKHVQVMSWRSL